MKYRITIVLLLLTFASKAQNQQPIELGIGFAIVSAPYNLGHLSTPSDIYKDSQLTQKLGQTEISPFFHKPDYGLFHFICLEKTSRYYKVLLNHNETAYLPNDTNYYFKTWEGILLQSTVERITKDNPIRLSSNDNSDIIVNNCEFDQLKVEDVIQKNGEHWLFVSFTSNCDVHRYENTKLKFGWIKWRVNDKLLVDILLLC